jgi:hypothetical protein
LSHLVQVETEVRDPAAVQAACRRLGLPEPVQGTAQLFSGAATCLVVRLPDWLYSIVCDTASGTLAYDNYAGAWGRPEHLGRFLQAYGLEKARSGLPDATRRRDPWLVRPNLSPVEGRERARRVAATDRQGLVSGLAEPVEGRRPDPAFPLGVGYPVGERAWATKA